MFANVLLSRGRRAVIGLSLILVLLAGCGGDDDPAAPATPAVPGTLVGFWAVTGVTVDGTAVDPAEFFGWDPAIELAYLEIRADGTYEYHEIDGAFDTLYWEEGTITATATELAAQVTAENGESLATPHTGIVGTYTIAGDLLHLTATAGADVVVIELTKGTIS